MLEFSAQTHPSLELLRRFGNGEVRGPEADRIAEHVETCAVCGPRLRDQIADPLLGRLQTLSSAAETRSSFAPGKVATIREGPAEQYDFLAPAQAPDEIGRLGPIPFNVA